MTVVLHRSMKDVLRLTRAGDLAGATGMIRSLLRAGHTSVPHRQSGATIDLKPERASVPFADPAAGNGAPAPDTLKRKATTAPTMASFIKRCYRGGAGVLEYRLFVPAAATTGMPLVVMLHGCTQSAEDFARGTGMNRLADELGFVVAYPDQTPAANPQKCWNWFNPSNQRRDSGEPALIAGVTREVIDQYSLDPERVYVAGLSAGGAAAAIMAAAYPELYAAAGIHSGLACGSAHDLPSALAAMRNGAVGKGSDKQARFVPVVTFHGDRDATVSEVNSREIIEAAAAATGKSLARRSETGQSPSGRRYTRETAVDDRGRVLIEQWTIHGAGHAWSGGDKSGSYTDPSGPDASRAMIGFFLGQGEASA